MIGSKHSNTLLVILMAAVVGLPVFSGPAYAQESPFSISVSKGGFTLYARKDAWRQQDIAVTNATGSPRSLTVVYSTADTEKGEARFMRIITVPPHSCRSVDLFVRMAELAKNDKKIGELEATGVSFKLTDTETGEQLSFGNDMMSIVPADNTLIAFITDTSDENEVRAYLTEMRNGPLGDVWVLDPPLPSYPDRWFGYDMANIVMVGGEDFGRLRPSQVQAVLDWTSRGGVLFLRGGSSLRNALDCGFAEAAGIEMTGCHRTITLDVSKATGSHVAEVSLPSALEMIEIAPTEAEVLYTANGLPLLTRHRYGQGWVFTLATPAAGLQDEKLQQIWTAVDDARYTRPTINDSNFAGPTLTALEQIAGRKAPPRSVPMAMMLAMAAATVAAGFLLRRKHGEWLWAVLAPAAVIIGVSLYIRGVSQTDPPRLSYVGVISGLDGDKVTVKGAFAYYSGPDSREMNFIAGNELTLIEDASAGQIGALTLTRTQCGAQMSLPDISLPPNSIRTFLLDGISTMPPIQASFTFGPDGAIGTITNNTDVDVQDAVIYISRRSYKVGDLPAGKSTDVTLAISDLLGSGSFSGSLTPSTGDKLRNTMLHTMAIKPKNDYSKLDDRPMLVAHAPIMPLDPLPGNELTRQGWSVLLWPVEITPPPPGTQIVMPAGFVGMKIIPDGMNVNVYNDSNNTFNDTHLATKLILLIGSKEITNNLIGAAIKLSIGINAPTCRMVVAGKSGNEYTEIKSVTGPVGLLGEIEIPNADRFLNADGQYEISIKMEKPAGPEDLTVWQFRSIDVSLEGKTR